MAEDQDPDEALLEVYRSGVELWVEDDATIHDPDHDTLSKASNRFWILRGQARPQTPDRIIDEGDCCIMVYILPRLYIFECRSYPGNSGLTVAHRRNKA